MTEQEIKIAAPIQHIPQVFNCLLQQLKQSLINYKAESLLMDVKVPSLQLSLVFKMPTKKNILENKAASLLTKRMQLLTPGKMFQPVTYIAIMK